MPGDTGGAEMRAGAMGAPLPRWVQISELLIREIAAGRLADGERLPPERQMAAALGISVGTLRKALGDLAGKGLLRRVQGSGNYVRHQAEVASVYAFFRLERPGGGGLPTAEVLSAERLPKPPDAPDFGPDGEGHRIRRLRRLDGLPVALEEIWLDGGQAARIRRADLGDSLYRYYGERLGLVIARVEDRVGVGRAPSWAPPGQPLQPGCVAGLVERIGRVDGGQAVEWSLTWFDPERTRYVSRMGKG